MIQVEKEVKIIITGTDIHLFSILCKTTLDDAGSRLNPMLMQKAKEFAQHCLSNDDIWKA